MKLEKEVATLKSLVGVAEEARLKAEDAMKGLCAELSLSKTMRKSLSENLGALQTRFDAANKIWREEVGKLRDHLKAQQRGMPYMII